MKALTLTQPWASLVAVGAKQVETRSWPTRHRGPLAIHAAKGLNSVGGGAGVLRLCTSEPFHTALEPLYRDSPGDLRLPLGAVVAVCDLLDVMPVEEERDALRFFAATGDLSEEDVERELAFGDYSPGRYAWVLAHIVPLPVPIVCVGALGLWTLPDHVAAYCRGAMAAYNLRWLHELDHAG